MKTALIGVSDKTAIVDFARALISLDYQIISTGGTLQTLTENGIKATAVSDITGFPEMMDGRVKTLHPKIHGGLLYLRDDEKHCQQAQSHSIQAIDLLVINLYPFEKTIANQNSTWSDIIENIDIGGPAMLRAAAKNYKFVTVVCDINDYETILNEIKLHGDTLPNTRLRLAQKVFALTSNYDSLIAQTLLPTTDHLLPTTEITLRYGENPHQSASFTKKTADIFTQLHGKELSYNNLLDIDAALKTILKFTEHTVAILKHTNPCGVASHPDIAIAYRKAFATDTISPFGGIVVTNTTVTTQFVNEINKVFTEILIAPDFDDEALQLLRKKTDRRLIKYDPKLLPTLADHTQTISCLNGYLSQIPDLTPDDPSLWQTPTIKKPTTPELAELTFAWQVVKMLKSNAICFTKDSQTIGMGIGQTSRIDSMNIAIEKAKKMGLDLKDSVCASDGFFPFRDSIDTLAQHGIKTVIQPGGSKADPEIIKACDEHNIAMVLTGKRHFRH